MLRISNWNPDNNDPWFSKPITLELPSLEESGEVHVIGGYSSISFPKLRWIVQRPYLGTSTTGELEIKVVAANVSVPALQNARYIKIDGATSIDLNLLEETRSVTIQMAQNASVNLPSLRKSKWVQIIGSITGVSLPAMQTIEDVRVHSALTEPNFKCKPLKEQWLRMLKPSSEKVHCYDGLFADSVDCKFNCESMGHVTFQCDRERTQEEYDNCCTSDHPNRLSTAAKAGIGIGAGLGGLLLIGLIYRLWAKWRSNKKKKRCEASRNVEMDGVTIRDEGRSSVDSDGTKMVKVIEQPAK